MFRRNTNFIIISFISDLICIILALLLANLLRFNLPFGRPINTVPNFNILIIEAVIIYPIIFLLFSIYDPERTYHAVDEYQLLSIASFIAALTLAGLVYFTARDISRLTLLYYYGLHFALITSWRAIVRLLRRRSGGRRRNLKRILLIGGGEAARITLERLEELEWAGIHLVGYLTNSDLIPMNDNSIPYLGELSDIDLVLEKEEVDDILVALPAEEYKQVFELVTQLHDKPSNIWVVPDYFSLLIYGGHVDDLGGVPMISLKSPTLTGYERLVKRAFDLLVGGIIQILILPLMGLIALAIRLDSPGPVIYKQLRVGEGGRMFWMYKFRTMVQDADERLSEVISYDDVGRILHKQRNDPRVTRFGKLLRKISLDELPQFYNVLKGDMSLVGPRPELPLLVEKYEPWQRVRFAVPQGITGWWQVNGRSDKPMHLNTEDDLYYVHNYSLILDLEIIVKTAMVVLRGKGAF
jgi:exopolysaccharide biosynthesis polyprenyl glycosylphosphotransferase